MSFLNDIGTAIVSALIGLIPTILQYYIPVFSERKSQRTQILKLISVEYNTVKRYISLVQRSKRNYYYGFLVVFYSLLTIIGYISIVFKQYDTYIRLITNILLILVALSFILIEAYSRLDKGSDLRKNTNINSMSLNMEGAWQLVVRAMFFLYWKSIRNISLVILFIFFLFFTLSVLVKGPTLISAFALSSTLSELSVIMALYVMRLRLYFTERAIKRKYKVDFPRSNSEGEMESEFFKIINDKPEICIEDSKGEICGRLSGIMYGIEIENINGVYIVPFTQILRIKKPVEPPIREDYLEPF